MTALSLEQPVRSALTLIALPVNQCGACEMSLPSADTGNAGVLPIITPEGLLLVRVQICRSCLDRAAGRGAVGIRQLTLTVCESINRHAQQPRYDPCWSARITGGDTPTSKSGIDSIAGGVPASNARDYVPER